MNIDNANSSVHRSTMDCHANHFFSSNRYEGFSHSETTDDLLNASAYDQPAVDSNQGLGKVDKVGTADKIHTEYKLEKIVRQIEPITAPANLQLKSLHNFLEQMEKAADPVQVGEFYKKQFVLEIANELRLGLFPKEEMAALGKLDKKGYQEKLSELADRDMKGVLKREVESEAKAGMFNEVTRKQLTDSIDDGEIPFAVMLNLLHQEHAKHQFGPATRAFYSATVDMLESDVPAGFLTLVKSGLPIPSDMPIPVPLNEYAQPMRDTSLVAELLNDAASGKSPRRSMNIETSMLPTQQSMEKLYQWTKFNQDASREIVDSREDIQATMLRATIVKMDYPGWLDNAEGDRDAWLARVAPMVDLAARVRATAQAIKFAESMAHGKPTCFSDTALTTDFPGPKGSLEFTGDSIKKIRPDLPLDLTPSFTNTQKLQRIEQWLAVNEGAAKKCMEEIAKAAVDDNRILVWMDQPKEGKCTGFDGKPADYNLEKHRVQVDVVTVDGRQKIRISNHVDYYKSEHYNLWDIGAAKVGTLPVKSLAGEKEINNALKDGGIDSQKRPALVKLIEQHPSLIVDILTEAGIKAPQAVADKIYTDYRDYENTDMVTVFKDNQVLLLQAQDIEEWRGNTEKWQNNCQDLTIAMDVGMLALAAVGGLEVLALRSAAAEASSLAVREAITLSIRETVKQSLKNLTLGLSGLYLNNASVTSTKLGQNLHLARNVYFFCDGVHSLYSLGKSFGTKMGMMTVPELSAEAKVAAGITQKFYSPANLAKYPMRIPGAVVNVSMVGAELGMGKVLWEELKQKFKAPVDGPRLEFGPPLQKRLTASQHDASRLLTGEKHEKDEGKLDQQQIQKAENKMLTGTAPEKLIAAQDLLGAQIIGMPQYATLCREVLSLPEASANADTKIKALIGLSACVETAENIENQPLTNEQMVAHRCNSYGCSSQDLLNSVYATATTSDDTEVRAMATAILRAYHHNDRSETQTLLDRAVNSWRKSESLEQSLKKDLVADLDAPAPENNRKNWATSQLLAIDCYGFLKSTDRNMETKINQRLAHLVNMDNGSLAVEALSRLLPERIKSLSQEEKNQIKKEIRNILGLDPRMVKDGSDVALAKIKLAELARPLIVESGIFSVQEKGAYVKDLVSIIDATGHNPMYAKTNPDLRKAAVEALGRLPDAIQELPDKGKAKIISVLHNTMKPKEQLHSDDVDGEPNAGIRYQSFEALKVLDDQNLMKHVRDCSTTERDVKLASLYSSFKYESLRPDREDSAWQLFDYDTAFWADVLAVMKSRCTYNEGGGVVAAMLPELTPEGQLNKWAERNKEKDQALNEATTLGVYTDWKQYNDAAAAIDKKYEDNFQARATQVVNQAAKDDAEGDLAKSGLVHFATQSDSKAVQEGATRLILQLVYADVPGKEVFYPAIIEAFNHDDKPMSRNVRWAFINMYDYLLGDPLKHFPPEIVKGLTGSADKPLTVKISKMYAGHVLFTLLSEETLKPGQDPDKDGQIAALINMLGACDYPPALSLVKSYAEDNHLPADVREAARAVFIKMNSVGNDRQADMTKATESLIETVIARDVENDRHKKAKDTVTKMRKSESGVSAENRSVVNQTLGTSGNTMNSMFTKKAIIESCRLPFKGAGDQRIYYLEHLLHDPDDTVAVTAALFLTKTANPLNTPDREQRNFWRSQPCFKAAQDALKDIAEKDGGDNTTKNDARRLRSQIESWD